MSAELRDSRRIASAWLLSLVGHLALVSGGAVIFARSLSDPADRLARPPPADDKIEIELPTMVEGSVAAGAAPVATPELLPRGGGEALPRPDSGSAGRGGTDTAAQPAYNLADRDDGAFLSSEVMSRLDRSQIARIETGAGDRASREDWRASRRPMELTFLASGSPDGKRAERRTPSKTDPSAGSEGAGVAAHRGSAPGAAERPEGVGEPTRAPGAAELGGDRSSPGSGVRDGRAGLDHRDSADVARGRPRVAEGTPSVPANVADKRRDTLDCELVGAAAIQSIVHASTGGGAAGAGRGGQEGAGPTGSGGVSGSGSRARALGTGKGSGTDNASDDPRRTDYLRRILAKVHPLWANAFPRWAAIEGLQGTVIVSFVVQPDGSIAGAAVTRPSGIPEFDQNCLNAVLRAAPFAPLPPELGRTYRISLPFEQRNPAVRPKDPAGPAVSP